jgi:peptidoglycan/xylan/chitin deacetylase (PgdA/CDA1 family)
MSKLSSSRRGNGTEAPRTIERAITLSVVDPLRRRLFNAEPGRLVILMYHRIAQEPEVSVRPYHRQTISPTLLAEHFAHLRDAGVRGVSLEEALATADEAPQELHRSVALTFDDGYADFAELAAPALARYGFTATVYLPTRFISKKRLRFNGHACLTWPEIRDLRKSGIRFGSHTVNHLVLYREPWSVILDELTSSRQTIEHELGEDVRSFAYPYAYPQFDPGFTRRFEYSVREAGYTSSVTTRIGRWRAGTNRFDLPRLPVNSADDCALLRAKLAGSYDWLSVPQMITKLYKGFSGARGSRGPE